METFNLDTNNIDELTDLLDMVPHGGSFEHESGIIVERAEFVDPDGWEFSVGNSAPDFSSHEAARFVISHLIASRDDR